MTEPSPGTEDRPARPPDASRRLIADRYEVVRVLGEGSSARTLLCSDRLDSRRVALKELRFSHAADWKQLELFDREGKMLAMLDHPGIPKIFDFFRSEGESSSLYIVQELIEGKSLQERMDAGPMLGQDEIRDVALGVLEVLEYLHGRAPPVLHRDIKPSNVLLREDGSVALIDFGGVCFGWRAPDVGGSTVIGTYGYMPPEQFVGQGGPTADLYSLGATLLHLATGRPPSEFPYDSGRIEVPSDLPVEAPLARLIEALLRPAPRDRPPSAGAARDLLSQPAQPESALVARPEPENPTVLSRRRVVVASDHGPRFVDPGTAPRDPKGELSDVYRNLIDPLFPARRLWSSSQHVVWLAVAGVLSVVTLLVAPAIYARGRETRRTKLTPLFREGRFTEGVIRSVDKVGAMATFRYEYEVDGSIYSALHDYTREMARYWGPGDVVPVLYDPHDPTRSCFLYR